MAEEKPDNDIPERDTRGQSIAPSTLNVEMSNLPGISRYGKATLGPGRKVALHVANCTPSIVVTLGPQLFIGRSSANSGPVDIDLDPYDGSQKGVSRKHAVILLDNDVVKVMDLASANGTLLNGERLKPYQARILRHGDELHLGRLSLSVSFI